MPKGKLPSHILGKIKNQPTNIPQSSWDKIFGEKKKCPKCNQVWLEVKNGIHHCYNCGEEW